MKTSAFVFSIPKLFPLLLAPEAPFQNPHGPLAFRGKLFSLTPVLLVLLSSSLAQPLWVFGK